MWHLRNEVHNIWQLISSNATMLPCKIQGHFLLLKRGFSRETWMGMNLNVCHVDESSKTPKHVEGTWKLFRKYMCFKELWTLRIKCLTHWTRG